MDTRHVANIGNGGCGDMVSVIDGNTCNAKNTSGCGQRTLLALTGNVSTTAAVEEATKTAYGDQRRNPVAPRQRLRVRMHGEEACGHLRAYSR